MPWDDAPPTAEELAPAAAGAWDSTPPTPEELKEPSFLNNLGHEVVDQVKQGAKLPKEILDPFDLSTSAMAGSLEPTKQKLASDVQRLKNLPSDLLEEGKRIGGDELVKGNLGNAVSKLGQAAYDKPISTVSDIATLFGLGSEAVGAIPGVPKIPAAAELPIKSMEAAPKPSVPTRLVQTAKSMIPENVRDFVGRNVTETPAKYLNEHAQNMALKSLGASPGQVRKIGIPQAEKLADLALDRNIVSAGTGDIGAKGKIEGLHGDSGKMIGDMRELAAKRGATHDIPSLVEQIKAQLDPKYLKGIASGEKGQYAKAIQEVERTPPTPDKVAQKITELFQHSKNMDRLKQPSGATADVARALRAANEDLISKSLSPQELTAYHRALEDFGAATQLREFVKRKQSTDMGGRLGPGSGITRQALQTFLDNMGYRLDAKTMKWLSDALYSKPKAQAAPMDMLRRYAHEAAEASDEPGGMDR